MKSTFEQKFKTDNICAIVSAIGHCTKLWELLVANVDSVEHQDAVSQGGDSSTSISSIATKLHKFFDNIPFLVDCVMDVQAQKLQWNCQDSFAFKTFPGTLYIHATDMLPYAGRSGYSCLW